MGALSILLLIVFGITSLLLIGVVLLQDEGGEGLGGIFGGGGAGPVGNRSGNILTKTTSVLGAIFLVTAFALAWLNRSPDTGNVEAAARQLEGEGDGSVLWWEVEENEDDGEPGLDDLESGEGNVEAAGESEAADEDASAE
jgi:preprotein translocase subunit SecG